MNKLFTQTQLNTIRSHIDSTYAIILSSFVLFSFSFFATYKVLQFHPISLLQETKKPTIQITKSQQAVCPLNGMLYDQALANDWTARRPLGVMIENHTDARPQSGLSKADIVYEAVAEGGITRFLAVFYCQDAERVGPVRSARTYFLDWISEYDGLYAHVGGAGLPGPADALGQIKRYGIRDLDEFTLGSKVFPRDQKRIAAGIAIEHTAYSSTKDLWQAASDQYGWGAVDTKTNTRWDDNFTPWQFVDEQKPSKDPVAPAQKITIPFWEKTAGPYVATWAYNADQKTYFRTTGAQNHIDELTNQQLSIKTLVILYMDESHADDGYPGNQHLLYGTIGSGQAVIIANGSARSVIWHKEDRVGRTRFTDANGQEISFDRGKIWLTIMPTSNKQAVKIL